MSASPTDWGELAELRQGLYRFFAGALLAPGPERLESVVAAAGLLDEMGVDDFAFAGAWQVLERELEVLPGTDAVTADYVRLFVAGSDGPLCPPVESRYRGSDQGGCSGSETQLDLRLQYASLGLKVDPATGYGADHVATELEAMASLCHKEAHAWEEENPTEAVSMLRQEWTFLSRHLAAWLPRLAAALRGAGATGFYPAVVTAADAFVRHDLELVTTLTRARLDGVLA